MRKRQSQNKVSHLAVLVHAILRAKSLRLGVFLALVVGSKAIVVVGEMIHCLFVLDEGG